MNNLLTQEIKEKIQAVKQQVGLIDEQGNYLKDSRERRWLRHNLFVLSENQYTIIASGLMTVPVFRRLKKYKDEKGIYVIFRNKKNYQSNWHY